MQAAIDAEHAHAEAPHPGEPNTEPLPRVTVSGSPSTPVAQRPASPSGVGPDFEPLPDQAAKPERRPPRGAKPGRTEVPLRAAKALRAAEELQAAEAARVRAPDQEPVRAPEPEPVRAAEPEPVWAEKPPPPAEPTRQEQPPRAAEPPRPGRSGLSAAFDDGPTPGSIGWLWPEDTATRGRGPRWRQPGGWGATGRWRYRTATLVALGAVVLAAVGLVIGMSLHSNPAAAKPPAAKATTTVRTKPTAQPSASTPAGVLPAGNAAAVANRLLAVSWVTRQVGAATVVACDAPTCAELTANGFPGQEVPVGLGSQTLSNAGIIIETPQLRFLLGTVRPSLNVDVGAAALARFGSGPDQVTVQVVDPNGAAAYAAALSQDVQARQHLGAELLARGAVSGSPSAESALRAGQVGSEVLLAIQAVTKVEPVYIEFFGAGGPRAGLGSPFRSAYIAQSDPSAATASPSYLPTMIGILRAHVGFPAPSQARPVILLDGQNVVWIKWVAPSPLGLLAS